MTEETKKISKITKIMSSYELVNDEEDFYDWIASHLYIHQQIASALGIS